MDQQTPVVFTNRKGHRLFGILETPGGGGRSDLGVILLSPGIKMRVGPECLYRRIADRFVRMGLPVLRFDFYGLGDSEGTLEEAFLKDVYNHIEVGRFVEDAIDAMNWMEEHAGVRRFILSGLCGGALTGLFTAQRDARAVGLLTLGMNATLSSRAANPSLYMTSGQLEHLRGKYVQKLLSPGAWLRLLSMKSDYRVIWRALTQPLRRKVKVQAPQAAPPPEADNASPLFPPAVFQLLEARRPILMVFSGADRVAWEFQEKFVDRYGERLASLPHKYEIHTVANANHVLSFVEWQDEMLEVSARWLQRNFAADVKAVELAASAAAG